MLRIHEQQIAVAHKSRFPDLVNTLSQTFDVIDFMETTRGER